MTTTVVVSDSGQRLRKYSGYKPLTVGMNITREHLYSTYGDSVTPLWEFSVHGDDDHNQRNEKISNKSSFGIIDIAEHSSTTDRIIVIVDTACFIHDGACR